MTDVPMMPEQLTRCDRCGEHGAMAKNPEDDSFICGHCAPKVSIFVLPLSGQSLEAQRLIDEELAGCEAGTSKTRKPRCAECGLVLALPESGNPTCFNCGGGQAKVVWW